MLLCCKCMHGNSTKSFEWLSRIACQLFSNIADSSSFILKLLNTCMLLTINWDIHSSRILIYMFAMSQHYLTQMSCNSADSQSKLTDKLLKNEIFTRNLAKSIIFPQINMLRLRAISDNNVPITWIWMSYLQVDRKTNWVLDCVFIINLILNIKIKKKYFKQWNRKVFSGVSHCLMVLVMI